VSGQFIKHPEFMESSMNQEFQTTKFLQDGMICIFNDSHVYGVDLFQDEKENTQYDEYSEEVQQEIDMEVEKMQNYLSRLNVVSDAMKDAGYNPQSTVLL